MVKYKLTWVPSPSPWATSQTVKGTVNGSAQTFLASAPLSVVELDVTFTESDVVDWFVSSVGENGLSADSVHDSFTASNLSVPAPATGLGHQFVEFVP